MRTVSIALVMLGCGSDPRPPSADFPDVSVTPGRAQYAFLHDGLERRFEVYIPAGDGPGRPLVIVLHGGGGSANQMFSQHPLEQAADEFGFVIAAAQGTPQDGDTTSFEWNGQVSLDSGVDDAGYLERIFLGLTSALEIDPTRRYLAGFSGGASMTVRFGAERTEVIAALATFAGKVGLSEAGGPFVFPPDPRPPLSVMMTYGTRDPNLAGEIKGDVVATSAQAGIDWWVDRLGCAPTPTTSVSGPLAASTYAGCAGGGTITLNVVQDMPHTWPERPAEPIAGTKLVMEFFAAVGAR